MAAQHPLKVKPHNGYINSIITMQTQATHRCKVADLARKCQALICACSQLCSPSHTCHVVVPSSVFNTEARLTSASSYQNRCSSSDREERQRAMEGERETGRESPKVGEWAHPSAALQLLMFGVHEPNRNILS